MIAKLHFISRQTETKSHLDSIKKALDAGCDWIQLRVKNQKETVVIAWAEEARILCDRYNAKLIINDFPEVAKAVGANGVHLGLQDMSLKLARNIVGPEMIIGGTANTLEDILQRVAEGADYVGLGPFRFTTTKEKLSPVLGPEGFAAIMEKLKAADIRIPVIAIGGLTAADVPGLMHAGLHGIAVSGAITQAEQPEKFIREVNRHFSEIPLAV